MQNKTDAAMSVTITTLKNSRISFVFDFRIILELTSKELSRYKPKLYKMLIN